MAPNRCAAMVLGFGGGTKYRIERNKRSHRIYDRLPYPAHLHQVYETALGITFEQSIRHPSQPRKHQDWTLAFLSGSMDALSTRIATGI